MAAAIGPGARLGRYEIDAIVGAGGMGEVYRAHDPILGRDVAVKVVAADKLDADHLARFEEEMRAAAAVTNPHIVSVYDSGLADGVPYLVTELLDGETLREYLRSGPVPSRKCFGYAMQILRGLDAAHRRGLVHLDLKPENLFVTAQGEIKILDFGIAKWIRPFKGLTELPLETDTAPASTVSGTLRYMAPEQLSGEKVDQRTDLFAFGVLAFEMLTGRPIFARATQADTARAIFTEDPPDSAAPGVPPAVIGVLRRCLEKNPEERFQQAHDVRLALEAAWTAPAADQPRRSSPSRGTLALAALALVLLVTAASLYTRTATPGTAPVLRLSVSAPEGTTAGLGAAISNDGSLLAMAITDRTGATRLWIRSLTDSSARELANTDGATYPFWSPDDGEVGFFAAGKLRVVPTRGGPPRDLCDAPLGRGGTWAGDTILFAPTTESGLSQVPAAGGRPVATTKPDPSRGEISHRFPSLTADGRHFVYLAMSKSSGTEGAVMFASIDRPQEPRQVMNSFVAAAWAPDDVLLFVRSGALWAQRFDRSSATLDGSPVGIAQAVQLPRFFGSPTFSVSRGGVMAYQPSLTSSATLVWRDRRGDLGDTVGLIGDFLTIRLAPDQHAVAVTIRDPQTSRPRLHVFDFARRVLTPVGSGDVSSRGAVWSPDSQRLAFTSNAQGANDLYIANLAQPAAPELLLKVGAIDLSPEVWTQDDRVVYSAASPGWGMYLLSVRNPRQPARLSEANAQQFAASVSPSMRWLTATSEESGRREIMAQIFPDATMRVQVSANGGQNAEWRMDGRELYFVNLNRQMMVVDVDERAGRFGKPQVLFDTYAGDPSGNPIVYDVSPDGQRFLMVKPRQDAAATTIVVNWPALMRR